VTGFIWHKSLSDCVIACSKDGTLRCHSLKAHPPIQSALYLPCSDAIPAWHPTQEAYRPYQHIRTVGLSWNVRNELANFYDHVDRDNPTAEYAGSSLFLLFVLPFLILAWRLTLAFFQHFFLPYSPARPPQQQQNSTRPSFLEACLTRAKKRSHTPKRLVSSKSTRLCKWYYPARA